MSFLDRFKIQPKHKSTDPEVRVAGRRRAAAGPLSEEDAAVLLALAREDVDARVRRAAIARIDDVGGAGERSRARDADAAIREEVHRAAGRRRRVGRPADAAMHALGALTDPKQICRTSRRPRRSTPSAPRPSSG